MQSIGLNNKTILVTGAAGFIDANLVLKLLEKYDEPTIICIHNINDYYDMSIKEWRITRMGEAAKRQNEFAAEHSDSLWTFVKDSLADKKLITLLFKEQKSNVVVNLSAQVGIRYSITNPDAYIESNPIGFYNIMEVYRHSCDNSRTEVQHLVY